MILSYTKDLIEKHDFINKIKSGKKIHSIREDPHNRWKIGMKIHHATGVRSKNYNCFKVDVVKSIQYVRIIHLRNPEKYHPIICINNAPGIVQDINLFSHNDGFNNFMEFSKYFNKDFIGKIIHWTDLKY